jgi:hypothetical protein
MSRYPLDRRRVLRGALAGAAVTVGLPFLEAFSGRPRAAHAASASPRRFGVFYWGNGIVPDHWVPATTGADWTPPSLLSPLSSVQRELTLVTGLEVKLPNIVPHYSGAAGILTGAPAVVRNNVRLFGEASVDQVVAAEIGGATRFRSLELGVLARLGVSFSSTTQRNPPETSPRATFDRLFGAGFRLPGEQPKVDPSLAARRSVLDAVLADARELEGLLGARDRARLDEHMTAVRELEQRILSFERDPPTLAACARPTPTDVATLDAEGRVVIRERSRAMVDLLVMALACDLTRVFSFTFSDPLSDDLFPGTSGGHHQLTHDEGGDQPQVRSVITYAMGELAYLVERLAAVQEGESRLIDHLAMMCTSDVSLGRTHSHADFPLMFVGSAGGALKTGLHVRSGTGDNASRFVLSLMRAVGVAAPSFGRDAGRATSGLSEIEA